MVTVHRQPVRLIQTRTGPRYVVQVPEPLSPIPGWRAYSVLAVGPNGDPPLHLTLYERVDGHLEAPDGPRAA
jgi:hypothetical protein